MRYCPKALETNVIYNSAKRCYLLINGPARWVVSKKEALGLSLSGSYLNPLGPLISWLARNVSRTLMVSNGLVNTVGINLIHRPIIDLHSPAGELRCSHQRTLWICDPRKLLNFLPESHVVAGYISRSLPYEHIYINIYIYILIYVYIFMYICIYIYVYIYIYLYTYIYIYLYM